MDRIICIKIKNLYNLVYVCKILKNNYYIINNIITNVIATHNARIKTMKTIFDIIKPPFKYDDYGQMIFDSDNHLVVNIRMWGLLQKEPNAAELQDGFGKLLAETLNKLSEQQK